MRKVLSKGNSWPSRFDLCCKAVLGLFSAAAKLEGMKGGLSPAAGQKHPKKIPKIHVVWMVAS